MGSHEVPETIDSFETHPDRYRHWKLKLEGQVATLTLAIEEENGRRPADYQLKQNSYDMGVDIELADAVQRLRFEHPEVRAVVVTSGLPKVFSAGANIRMLATSTHAYKVNFCKFTNETRCAIEDATAAGQVWLCAANGTAAGGGYELALACSEIYLIDDGSSAVSLPEVPLLGVLPGTGGLTRLVDKRRIRRDVADVFCTKAEGFRARDALKYGFVDATFPRSKWDEGVRARASAVAAQQRAPEAKGVVLPPLDVEIRDGGREYRHVSLRVDRQSRVATLEVRAPADGPTWDVTTWACAAFRELDDALLHLRFNEPEAGLVLLTTRGDAEAVLAHDEHLAKGRGTWLADEITALRARVLRRLDNTARSLFAVIDEGSCFAGSLFELALAADRSYMLDAGQVRVRVTSESGGPYPMAHGPSRLAVRFSAEPTKVAEVLSQGEALAGAEAFELGLVTLAPDDIDWEDELRIAVEERSSLSPDALTGMEQNLRFVGAENCDTKIFGRLSAWQNWIFQRPNAVGDAGALTLYGHPERPRFDWRRT